MSAEQVRETLQQYLEVLRARGSYGRFFDDDTEFALMGTDQQTRGAEAAEQTIRYLHETAFALSPSSRAWWSTSTARPQRLSSSALTSAISQA
jgi:hypothetical protein